MGQFLYLDQKLHRSHELLFKISLSTSVWYSSSDALECRCFEAVERCGQTDILLCLDEENIALHVLSPSGQEPCLTHLLTFKLERKRKKDDGFLESAPSGSSENLLTAGIRHEIGLFIL